MTPILALTPSLAVTPASADANPGRGAKPGGDASRGCGQHPVVTADPAITSAPAGGRGAEQALRAFLLEVQRPSPPKPARAYAQIRHRGAHRGLREHPQPERQGGGADVEPSLDRERRRHRIHVALGELPVAPVPGLNGREQAERLPVAEHPG